MKKTIKDELGDYFKKLAEKYDWDETKVVTEFEKQYEAVSKSPSMMMKSDAKRVKRTKAQMSKFFANIRKNGEPFVFIPFGHISNPMNWNGKEIKDILTEAKSGLLPKLLREEKIMYKTEAAGRVAMSKVTEYGKRKVYIKDDNKYLKPVDDAEEVDEYFVVDGLPLRSGDNKVIPRDYRYYTSDSKDRVNFRWSRELIPTYTAEVWGFGFPKSDEDNVRMMHFRAKNNQADPNSQEFFFRKYPPFRSYEADFSIDDTNGWFELSYIGALNPQNAEIAGVDDNNIDDAIELNLDEIREKYAREGVKCYVPPVIYIDGIKEYHKTTCKLDAAGKVEKSKKGWDITEWGRYAILLADFEKGTYSTDMTKSNFYLFSDGDVDFRTGAFGDPTQFNMSPIQPSTPIISVIRTGRGPNRYDFKSGKRVPDPENGDININVSTIRALPRVEVEIDDEEDFEDD